MVRKRGASWQVDLTHGGRRHRRSFELEADALRWETEARIALAEGRELPEVGAAAEAAPTLNDLLKLVDDLHWKHNKDGDGSYRNAEMIIEKLGESTKVADIKTQHIDRIVMDMQAEGLTGSTINRRLSSLGKMLRIAHRRGWITAVPHIPRQRESKHRLRWYTSEEEDKVLTHLTSKGDTDMATLVMVLADTGLRLSEALGLNRSNIDDGMIRLHSGETKTDAPRTVPMTGRVKLVVEAALAQREELFPDLTIDAAGNRWKRCRDALGLGEGANLHAWRHTFCSRLAQRGADLSLIKELAGHKNVATTTRYAHLSPARLRQGIELLDGKGLPSLSGHDPIPRPNLNPSPSLRLVKPPDVTDVTGATG